MLEPWMKFQRRVSLLMRGKWIVKIMQGDHALLSSGDLWHDEWIDKFVSRYMRCLNPGEHIVIEKIDIKGKRLTNPVFSYKEYE